MRFLHYTILLLGI